MSLWLSSDELIDYTGFRQREKQYTALAQLGTAFKIRPADGFPLVLREHVVPKQGKAVRRERVRAMNHEASSVDSDTRADTASQAGTSLAQEYGGTQKYSRCNSGLASLNRTAVT